MNDAEDVASSDAPDPVENVPGPDDESTDVSNLPPEELVRMGCLETLNAGNIEAAPRYYTDDATYYTSDSGPLDLADLIDDAKRFRDAFSDLEATIEEVVVDEERNGVTFRYSVRGTHDGEYEGIPPTGERFERQGIGFAELEGGLIDEYRLVFDRLGMLKDLGLV